VGGDSWLFVISCWRASLEVLVFHQVIISSQSRYYRHSSLKRLLHYSELIDFSKKLSTAAESK
jgi:hypothetical protein